MSDIRWLLLFARQASLPLLGSVLSRIAGHVLGAVALAVPAWAVGVLALESMTGSFVTWIVVAVVVAAFAKAGLRYVEQFLGHLAAFRLMGEMRVWIIDRLIPQAPAVTDGLGAARVHTIAVRNVDRVEVFFAHTIAPAVTAVVIPLTGIIVAFAFAGSLPALTLFAVYLIGYAVALAGAQRGRQTARAAIAARAELTQFVSDTIRLREDLLVHNAVPHRLRQAAAIDDELSAKMTASGIKAGTRNGINTLRVWGGTTVVLVSGIPAMTADIGTLPGVLLAASLVAGTANSMDSIERLASSLPAGLEAVRRIRELGAAEPSVTEPASPAPTPSTERAVQLRASSYCYPGAESNVLEDIDIDVPAGAFIGIAGPTGSGKSTVARLIQRHFDTSAGTVIVHGVDVRELGSKAVQRVVAVADQDPFVMEGTVAENLRLGAPEATDETLYWALTIAEIDTTEIPLSKRIARRGSNLSGGQKQRLALARTLVRASADLRRAVIVLDEATSHQDPLTQERIISNLRELGATVILIAHRLTTLQYADQIYVIEAGQLVEKGTFRQLATAGGLFTTMLESAE